MPLTIDPHVLTQTTLDSGSLTVLAALIHSFPEPGQYRGVSTQGTSPGTVFFISVDPNSPALQADVDLPALQNGRSSTQGCSPTAVEPGCHFVVNPRGHVVFFVSSGAGGFTVKVRNVNANVTSFDSQQLKPGDLLAATLIRPGTHSVTNASGGPPAQVRVAYPTIGNTPFRPPDPVTIQCTPSGFSAASIALQPGQGQIYQFAIPSRIKIELIKPDDGPSGTPTPAAPKRK
jgi:hypothetical protein